jgi:hypothetical protein
LHRFGDGAITYVEFREAAAAIRGRAVAALARYFGLEVAEAGGEKAPWRLFSSCNSLIGFQGGAIMIKRTTIGKTPREYFMRTADDEFAKFERQERALRQAEREERAAQLRLPLARNRTTSPSQEPN